MERNFRAGDHAFAKHYKHNNPESLECQQHERVPCHLYSRGEFGRQAWIARSQITHNEGENDREQAHGLIRGHFTLAAIIGAQSLGENAPNLRGNHGEHERNRKSTIEKQERRNESYDDVKKRSHSLDRQDLFSF